MNKVKFIKEEINLTPTQDRGRLHITVLAKPGPTNDEMEKKMSDLERKQYGLWLKAFSMENLEDFR